jgi:hypothetical protein
VVNKKINTGDPAGHREHVARPPRPAGETQGALSCRATRPRVPPPAGETQRVVHTPRTPQPPTQPSGETQGAELVPRTHHVATRRWGHPVGRAADRGDEPRAVSDRDRARRVFERGVTWSGCTDQSHVRVLEHLSKLRSFGTSCKVSVRISETIIK